MTEEDARKNVAAQIASLHRDVTFELQRRERPDRHAYQTGCLSGLLVVAIMQLIIGLPPQSALYETATRATITALNVPMIVGCVMCLWGAALSRDKHFVLSLRLGIYGHMSLFVASVFYTLIVMVATNGPGTKPYWLAVTSVGLSLGIAYASVQRFRQMQALLREYLERQQKRKT